MKLYFIPICAALIILQGCTDKEHELITDSQEIAKHALEMQLADDQAERLRAEDELMADLIEGVKDIKDEVVTI